MSLKSQDKDLTGSWTSKLAYLNILPFRTTETDLNSPISWELGRDKEYKVKGSCLRFLNCLKCNKLPS